MAPSAKVRNDTALGFFPSPLSTMVPLLLKPGLAAVALKWRLALAVPLHVSVGLGDASAQAGSLGLANLPAAELATVLKEHPEKLGSISVGKPSRGALINGVTPHECPALRLVAKDAAFGTDETVESLERVAARMQELFPGSSPLVIGHISDKDGGRLRPHLSHQSGRDVDLGFYYLDKPTWYRRANAKNLDLERTWALLRTLVTETDVEMIFLDQGLQGLLLDFAKKKETDHEWLELLFRGRGLELPTIRHARGHATHLHVRFYSPRAQRLGHDLYPLLVEQSLVPPIDTFQTYTAKKGDSLEKLSRLFGVSVKQLKLANGMKGNTLIAKQSYRIPLGKGVAPAPAPVEVPPRRLPKTETLAPPQPVRPSASPSTAARPSASPSTAARTSAATAKRKAP